MGSKGREIIGMDVDKLLDLLRRAGGEVGEESNKSITHKLPGKERK